LDSPTSGFAKRLRIALAADERTQGEIAQAADVPPDQLSRWKGGNVMPEIESVIRLVRALGVSGHWLLTGEGPMDRVGDEALRLQVIGRVANGTLDDAAVKALATLGQAEPEAVAQVLLAALEALGELSGPKKKVSP
jgi:transcriptional regulator with XRE-family HTH domain